MVVYIGSGQERRIYTRLIWKCGTFGTFFAQSFKLHVWQKSENSKRAAWLWDSVTAGTAYSAGSGGKKKL